MTVKAVKEDRRQKTEDRGQNKNILVLGLGNILLKDEGIGVHIAHQMQRQELPDNVEVVDGGTAALDMLLLRECLSKLVVIDAIKGGKKAGTIYKARIKGGEIEKLTRILSRGEDLKISSHQFGLIDALAAAEKMNPAPLGEARVNCSPREIVIIGVEPKEMDYGLELTEQVNRRIPEIVNMVLEEF